jgi:TatA/E family protein of Tat protein translocase
MSIGPTEIIVVLVIALLVFGPGRLPQMGRTLGKGLREFKNAANTAKDELGLTEVLDDVNDVKDSVLSAAGVDEIKESISGVTSTIDDAKRSAGLEEITAGVGTVKAAMSFDPRKAAKDLVTGGSSSKKAAKADGSEPDAQESASPAGEHEAPAGEPADPVADADESAAAEGLDDELAAVSPAVEA